MKLIDKSHLHPNNVDLSNLRRRSKPLSHMLWHLSITVSVGWVPHLDPAHGSILAVGESFATIHLVQ